MLVRFLKGEETTLGTSERIEENGPPLAEVAIREFAGRSNWSGKLFHEPDTNWYEPCLSG
jgi:hypothetical protein